MWILESNGDFLQGKRIWLRPGKTYLFGRVKKEGVSHAIDHKTISRKHFVIEVAPVKSGDFTRLHTRSRVSVKDENSKGGTQLDGHPLRGGLKELDQTEHSLRPGTYPHVLKIEWVPVCLTFSLSGKERKVGDPLSTKRERLEELDIKASIDYVTDKTTHVVQAKRNTVAGLQALLNGRYIVTDEYIDAVVYGATPGDLEEPENLCPLERDFDTAWPDPLKYLPPPGKEQTAHPAEVFAPNPERSFVFEGYTFIFGDRKQHDNLLPAITNGHGKALVCKADFNKTNVEDIVKFMRNVAGEKRFGDFSSPLERGGVILVRWITKPEMQEWANELADKVALQIGQRSIDQRDFLDAVVGNDARKLRQGIEKPDDLPIPSADSSKSISSREGSWSRQPSPPDRAQGIEHSKRSELRDRGVSRIKTFDDGFDMNSITSFTAADDEASQSHDDQDGENEVPEASQPVSRSSKIVPEQGKRKRSPTGGEEDMVDELLPAARAMKKRRLEVDQASARKHSRQTQAQSPKKIISEPKPEIDIREAAKKRREAEEEAARRDKEVFNTTVDEDELRRIKETLVEEMVIPVRTSRFIHVPGDTRDRWDERWNGRKNFKGFRRKGDAQWRPNHTRKIMVPLVEVKKQSYGIGQEYWDDSDSEKAKKQGKKNRSSHGQRQSQSQNQPQEKVSEEHASPIVTRLQQEAADVVGEVDVEQPRTTRLTDKTQQSQRTMNQAQGAKRPSSGTNSRATKRQKTIRPKDSEDDDEPKFQFGRRKKT